MNDDKLSKLEQTLENVAQTHRHDYVIDTARQILALSPNHEGAHNNLILAYYRSGKYEDMRQALDAAAAYFSTRAWFHFFYYLYYLYIGGSEYTKARDHIKTAISMEPSVPHYYRSLGEIYLINREAKKAVPYFAKAVELAPTHAEYRARLALGLLRMHKVRESLEMANLALKDGVDDPKVFDDVGMIYTLSGDLDRGEVLFRVALEKAPTHDYFQSHIDWVLREKQDRQDRLQRGLEYTPLYIRHKGSKRFFDEDVPEGS